MNHEFAEDDFFDYVGYYDSNTESDDIGNKQESPAVHLGRNFNSINYVAHGSDNQISYDATPQQNQGPGITRSQHSNSQLPCGSYDSQPTVTFARPHLFSSAAGVQQPYQRVQDVVPIVQNVPAIVHATDGFPPPAQQVFAMNGESPYQYSNSHQQVQLGKRKRSHDLAFEQNSTVDRTRTKHHELTTSSTPQALNPNVTDLPDIETTASENGHAVGRKSKKSAKDNVSARSKKKLSKEGNDTRVTKPATGTRCRRTAPKVMNDNVVPPYAPDASLDSPDACREFLASLDPTTNLKLDLNNDDWQEIKQSQLHDYTGQIFNALTHAYDANVPEDLTWDKDKQKDYEAQQDRETVHVRNELQSPMELKIAKARCMLLINSAISVHEHGVPVDVHKKYQSYVDKGRKATHDHNLEMTLICSARLANIVNIVKGNKLIARDILAGKNLDRMAQAPDSCLRLKFKYLSSNSQRQKMASSLKEAKEAQSSTPTTECEDTKGDQEETALDEVDEPEGLSEGDLDDNNGYVPERPSKKAKS